MDIRGFALKALAILAIVFGLLTIKSGGEVVLGVAGAREAAGNYLPFVVWFNFLAGFAYLAAGVGIWLRRRWAAVLAIGIAIATAVVFAAFGIHVASGGAYEMRTVGALSLRLALWSAMAWYAWRVTRMPQSPVQPVA